jgi:hypothetical protein
LFLSANTKENEPANQIGDAAPAVEIKSVEAVAVSHKDGGLTSHKEHEAR